MADDEKPMAAVIDFATAGVRAKDGPPLTTTYSLGCRHKHSVIDKRARSVECRDCEASLDPIEVLWYLANHYARYHYALDQAIREVRKMEARLKELKREERNTKARIARAKRKEH
ncbi:hypothetical protein LCGC14_0258370 [marine sediment metagenome]|uniref:Uncharacterized protein n=1 Tax=marine sediment metagenome TaxID=412755 RepID=A0A0F9UJ58_9ZZZZ